ncbi:MAG: SET domain-containing protein [Pyrinomonadaceae bacterium]
MSKNLEVRDSVIYEKGCFTLVPLPGRKKIASFAGEVLVGKGRIEARLRTQPVVKIIRLTDDVAIDGEVGGDATAYLNHSCAPNAFMRNAPGHKVIFIALRDIAAGEEITIDYRDPDHPEVCRCGARQCRSNALGHATGDAAHV